MRKARKRANIDLIVIYNSGRYRRAGRGSLAGLLACPSSEVESNRRAGARSSGSSSLTVRSTFADPDHCRKAAVARHARIMPLHEREGSASAVRRRTWTGQTVALRRLQAMARRRSPSFTGSGVVSWADAVFPARTRHASRRERDACQLFQVYQLRLPLSRPRRILGDH